MTMQDAGEHRDVTAFFATRRAADRATENLRSAGFGPDRVKVEEGPSAGGGAHGYTVRVAVTGDQFERVTEILDDESTLAMDERGSTSATDALNERMQEASAGLRETVSSVRETLSSGAQHLRERAERMTGHSTEDLAAHARETAGHARQAAMDTSGAVMGYVRANPLISLGIAFGVGMLLGMRRR